MLTSNREVIGSSPVARTQKKNPIKPVLLTEISLSLRNIAMKKKHI